MGVRLHISCLLLTPLMSVQVIVNNIPKLKVFRLTMPAPQLAADVSDVDCLLNCDSESISIGANNPEAYLHLPIVLRAAIEKSTAIFDKEKAHERLSKPFGSVTVFKVRKASKAEVGERKDWVIDALNATRAVMEEGIVPDKKMQQG